MRRRCLFRPTIVLTLFPSQSARGASDDHGPIGQQVDNLEFKDIRFLTRSLDDFGTKKAFVIVATKTTCPVVQRDLPVLAQFEKQHRDRGVQFLALNVGPDDSITEMAAQSVEAIAEFPFVKDIDSASVRTYPKGTTFEVLAHFDNSEFNPITPIRRGQSPMVIKFSMR